MPIDGRDEPRIGAVWVPKNPPQLTRGAAQQGKHNGCDLPPRRARFEISPARQSPNAADMVNMALGNELNTKGCPIRSRSGPM